MRRLLPPLTAVLLAACSSVPPPPPAGVLVGARERDDDALAAAADRMGFLEDHYVAVAGGRFLGGAMMAEDVAGLVAAVPPPLDHAYFFQAGDEGDREVRLPALYADALAGNGLLKALGVTMTFDATTGTATLERGGLRTEFRSDDGACRVPLRVTPASRTADAVVVVPVVSTGFEGTLILPRDDASRLRAWTSEIPGRAALMEVLTGRRTACRRVLLRVEIAELGTVALVDCLYPER